MFDHSELVMTCLFSISISDKYLSGQTSQDR